MPGKKPDRPQWVRHSSVGVEFAAAVGGFTLVGLWIDTKYDSKPWGLLIGVALGLIGGTYNLIRSSLAAFKPPVDEDSNDDSDDSRILHPLSIRCTPRARQRHRRPSRREEPG